MEGMTEAEKKKYRSKQRKTELKAQKEAEEKKAQADQELTKKGGKVDEDPEGIKYTKAEDPLGEALKFLRPLQELASERIETHLMGFEIYIRKSMYICNGQLDHFLCLSSTNTPISFAICRQTFTRSEVALEGGQD